MFNFTDCFDLLTPEQQMNFRHEFKRLHGEDLYKKAYAYQFFEHPKQIIACAFDWTKTSQGVDYWRNLYRELEKVMNLFEYSFSNN
jgi:hypothetical protein